MTTKTLLEIAKSKATAKRMTKGLEAKDIKKAIDNLQAALVATKKREAKHSASKKTADLKKLRLMIEKMGIAPADVRALVASPPKRKTGPRKGRKVAPKYQLKVGKQTHKWTGRGRMPLIFKSHIESGGSLESCLIKKSN